jgi:hypothetical protein
MRKAEDQIRCFMWNRSKRTYTTGVLGGFTGTRGLVPIGKVIFLDLGVACDTVERYQLRLEPCSLIPFRCGHYSLTESEPEFMLYTLFCRRSMWLEERALRVMREVYEVVE